MDIEAAEEWRAERSLEADQQAVNAATLFRFAITTPGDSVYYCNEIEERELSEGRTRLVLTDVWVKDDLLPVKLLSKVEVVTSHYDICHLPGREE